jgi:hypothetical protein
MEQRAEIICSYLKMNNKDDEFNINLTNEGFYITQNNNKIFTFEQYSKHVFIAFCIQTIMIRLKILNKTNEISYIDLSKILKNYDRKYKNISYDNIDLNSRSYIQYSCKKDYITFIGIINTNIYDISYRINIKYHNKFIYKSHDTYLYMNHHFKYTNYKICIPNKYELLYYSKYFLMYL